MEVGITAANNRTMFLSDRDTRLASNIARRSELNRTAPVAVVLSSHFCALFYTLSKSSELLLFLSLFLEY
jgi:hypothetical protein